MTNKVVDITIQNLDITQLVKMRETFSTADCSRTSVRGAYRYELCELLDTIIQAGYANKSTIKSPELTI